VNIKEIGMDQVMILPPKPGTCPVCAVKHDPAWPHNRDSLYYQMRFQQQHGRFPNWADAIAHCSEEMKAAWKEALLEKGVKPELLEEHGQQRVDGV
jgi:hypothetical protein